MRKLFIILALLVTVYTIGLSLVTIWDVKQVRKQLKENKQ